MNTAVLVLLAFLLSGIPATAVVCDLVLCAAQAAAPAHGCHEHVDQAPGDVISPSTGGCTHLSETAPFVTASPRAACDAASPSIAPAPPKPYLDTPGAALTPRYAASPHAPLVLRI